MQDVTQEMKARVYLVRAVEEIASSLGDLARVLIQGIRPDNEAMRGNIALGLERAASYVRGNTFVAKVEDNPENDATDFAHPAWWRGNDAGVFTLCTLINKILDGEDLAGFCSDPWHTTRERIYNLVREAKK